MKVYDCDCDLWYVFGSWKGWEKFIGQAARFLYWELIDFTLEFWGKISEVKLTSITLQDTGCRLKVGSLSRNNMSCCHSHSVTRRKIQVQEMFSLGSGALPGPPCSLITSEWTIMSCYNSPLHHDVAQSSTEMINLIISHLSPHIYLLIETISP